MAWKIRPYLITENVLVSIFKVPATVNGSADGPPRMTPAAEQLYNKLSPHLDNGGLHKIATEIQQDRSVRVWRIHANEVYVTH